jgi:hypothetical protein
MQHIYILGTQVAISCSSLVFAMVMLYKGKDPGVYLPIITGIVGCWLPSPQSIKAPNQTYETNQTDKTIDIEQPLL